jgi:type II secretory pathway pseudopilin PulG
MKKRGFSLLESTVVLLVSTLILGAAFTLTNINKKFYEFQKTKLLLAENLKLAQDLSFKKIELSNPTTTVCGVGILITSSGYLGVAYATSADLPIDCYKIASSSPTEFDFTSKNPNLYFTKSLQITNNLNNPLIVKEDFENLEILFSTSSQLIPGTSSIIFVHPYGDPLIHLNQNKINFDKEFNIILRKDNENATITITTAGQIIAK